MTGRFELWDGDSNEGTAMTPLELRVYARRAAARALKSGELTRQVCEVCGNPRTQMHHDDYGKPLVVRHLCSKHHAELHRRANGPPEVQAIVLREPLKSRLRGRFRYDNVALRRFVADAIVLGEAARAVSPDCTPDRVQRALRLLAIAEMADALGLETTPHPDGGVTMYDADAVLYSGDLDRAEQWLREADLEMAEVARDAGVEAGGGS